ncbi:hypothetical protein DFH27DRAFT_639672 [Peziza echinospora]|nr:hypothetical protein DFH27DRAFT_639672 [Peziza echinospora]
MTAAVDIILGEGEGSHGGACGYNSWTVDCATYRQVLISIILTSAIEISSWKWMVLPYYTRQAESRVGSRPSIGCGAVRPVRAPAARPRLRPPQGLLGPRPSIHHRCCRRRAIVRPSVALTPALSPGKLTRLVGGCHLYHDEACFQLPATSPLASLPRSSCNLIGAVVTAFGTKAPFSLAGLNGGIDDLTQGSQKVPELCPSGHAPWRQVPPPS